ncbi:MAG: AraC family transcriptional regulator [Verrucomicrobiota bacterium JB024]|nr:AraC family transcriptional regulator [Verrucomicrobiota bacterium JB024]
MQAQLESIPEAVNRSFVVREFRQPRFTTPWHYHPEYEITLIEGSTGELFIGDRITPFGPGELYVIGADLPHCFYSPPASATDEHAHARVVQFRREPLAAALETLEETRPILDLLARASRGLRIHGEALTRASERLRALQELRGLPRLLELLQLLATLADPATESEVLGSEGFLPQLDKQASRRMSRVYDYVLAHLDGEINLPRAAAAAGMSLSAFSRYFRKMAGKPFTHFVNEVRIARASRLLIESPLSVSEIAFACGYGSLSNFNRCFRLHATLSPSEFRRRHRQTETG